MTQHPGRFWATARQRITAFVCWAHAHADVDPATWAETVFRLTAELRRLGIDADIDLGVATSERVPIRLCGRGVVGRV